MIYRMNKIKNDPAIKIDATRNPNRTICPDQPYELLAELDRG